MVIRGADVDATMSRYLVERISAAPNIEVRCCTEVAACRGEGYLEALTLVNRDTGEKEEVAASWLFVFIGASPHTGWLAAQVVRDANGFVVTGQELSGTAYPSVWLDSMKRVASAVGEGAMSVHLVHRYLATI